MVTKSLGLQRCSVRGQIFGCCAEKALIQGTTACLQRGIAEPADMDRPV